MRPHLHVVCQVVEILQPQLGSLLDPAQKGRGSREHVWGICLFFFFLHFHTWFNFLFSKAYQICTVFAGGCKCVLLSASVCEEKTSDVWIYKNCKEWNRKNTCGCRFTGFSSHLFLILLIANLLICFSYLSFFHLVFSAWLCSLHAERKFCSSSVANQQNTSMLSFLSHVNIWHSSLI